MIREYNIENYDTFRLYYLYKIRYNTAGRFHFDSELL